ncbi:LapA family protein [Phyllobacterium sp. 628]|uniref:LapA family protein n=1 Tax=Phyllobacterium sp. 628 TaxID=2718938 RepID=UPI0016625FDB|nr:LapA family protein [Phyllobacterium sp. 628]QND51565.1 LapA family protein [Phyllobacterium sp. 628]
MVNRVIVVLILVPLAVILIALSVANRGLVTFTIDPFNPGNPGLSYGAPLFVWLFAAMIIGLILGSFATWFNQGKHRKLARQRKQEAELLRIEARKSTAATPTPNLPSLH